MRGDLPDFNKPPVNEVVLSLQFAPLERLCTPEMGAFWSVIKGEFPHSEEHPPINPVMEGFDGSEGDEFAKHVGSLTSAPIRHWYRNDDGTSLIQIQKDRFIQNWRKGDEGQKYPHFEHVLECFKENLGKFEKFLLEEKIGQIVPNQCEVTYINQIPKGEGWDCYNDIGDVITLIAPKNKGDFLPEVEHVRLGSSFIIPDNDGNPIGRLHISFDPGIRRSDGRPILRLDLTARGRPLSEYIQGAFDFFDIGHEWIVRGFDSVTSAKMHEIWERKDG